MERPKLKDQSKIDSTGKMSPKTGDPILPMLTYIGLLLLAAALVGATRVLEARQ